MLHFRNGGLRPHARVTSDRPRSGRVRSERLAFGLTAAVAVVVLTGSFGAPAISAQSQAAEPSGAPVGYATSGHLMYLEAQQALTAASEVVAPRRRINAAHDLATRHAGAALEHARTAGRLLIEVKESLAHGEWLPWLETSVAVSARQAQRYIRLAQGKALPERKPAALPENLKCDTVSHLPEIGPGELFVATAEHGDWWDELVVMPYVDNAFAHYMHTSGTVNDGGNP